MHRCAYEVTIEIASVKQTSVPQMEKAIFLPKWGSAYLRADLDSTSVTSEHPYPVNNASVCFGGVGVYAQILANQILDTKSQDSHAETHTSPFLSMW